MRTCIVPLFLGLTAVTALARIDVAPGANKTKAPSRLNAPFARRVLLVDEDRLDLDLNLLQPVAGAVNEDMKPYSTSTAPTTTITPTRSKTPKHLKKPHAKSPSKVNKPHTKSRSKKPQKPTPPTTSPIPNDRQPPGNSYHRHHPTTQPHSVDPTPTSPTTALQTSPSQPPSHSPEPTPENSSSPNPYSVTTSSEASPAPSVTPSPTSPAVDPPRTTEIPEPRTSSSEPLPTGNGDGNHSDPTPGRTSSSFEPTPAVNSPTTTVDVPTTVPVTTTTTTITTTTTTSTTTTITTTATTAVVSPVTSSLSTHHSRPTTTTTPWLPSSIEPIAPPKTTSTPSPGTSLPEVVIPNVNPVIPPGSFHVHLRFEHVSYYQVINNGVLAAQLVSFIPAQLAQVLDIDSQLVMVLAIRDGSLLSSNNKKRSLQRRGVVASGNVQDAVLVTATVPQSQYYILQGLVANKVSALYVPGPNTFGQFLDPTYPLSNQPPSRSGSGTGSGNGNNKNGNSDDENEDVTADPLTGTLPDPAGGTTTSGKLTSRGPIIGSLVGLATVAYVGIALVVMRAYRRKKLREQDEQARREAFQQSISAPVIQGSQGWGWHSS